MQLVEQTLPQNAEALGCSALISLCEARRRALLGTGFSIVPLDEQDVSLWDEALLARGFQSLARAAACGQGAGPFQLEAAIQAAHCYRARSGSTPWQEIAVLYERLIEVGPTLGGYVGRAIAIAYAADSAALGLAQLDALPIPDRGRYQPYWLAKAHLSERCGDRRPAREALDRALSLTLSSRQARFIERWRSRLADA